MTAHPGKVEALGSTSLTTRRSWQRRTNAGDVTLLINNAGVNHKTGIIARRTWKRRAEMRTNFFGTLAVIPRVRAGAEDQWWRRDRQHAVDPVAASVCRRWFVLRSKAAA